MLESGLAFSVLWNKVKRQRIRVIESARLHQMTCIKSAC